MRFPPAAFGTFPRGESTSSQQSGRVERASALNGNKGVFRSCGSDQGFPVALDLRAHTFGKRCISRCSSSKQRTSPLAQRPDTLKRRSRLSAQGQGQMRHLCGGSLPQHAEVQSDPAQRGRREVPAQVGGPNMMVSRGRASLPEAAGGPGETPACVFPRRPLVLSRTGKGLRPRQYDMIERVIILNGNKEGFRSSGSDQGFPVALNLRGHAFGKCCIS